MLISFMELYQTLEHNLATLKLQWPKAGKLPEGGG